MSKVWTENDEQYLLVCKNALAKYQTTDEWDASIISQWLENKLKGGSWVKRELSKEDKDKFNRIYSILQHAADTHPFGTSCRLIGDNECIELQDWLRSLKERMER